jgi:DNA-binding transcriptional ArsR family regulator
LPLLRSPLQGELLAATLLTSGEGQSLTDLAQQLGVSLSTVYREVTRLEQAGILRTRRVGRTRIVEPNRESPIHEPLVELILRSLGPAHVVAEEFAEIPNTDEVIIFGSWAARYHGREGPGPADVDVLVIGRPNRDEVYEAALRAERRLRQPVNPVIRSREEWERGQEGFLRQVRSAPLVRVREE